MTGDEIVQGLGPHDVVAPGAFGTMPKRVELVIHENGQRKVIGEAVVDTDGQYLDVTGVVTDPAYQIYIRGHSDLVLSLSSHERNSSVKVRYQPEFKASIPLDKGVHYDGPEPV